MAKKTSSSSRRPRVSADDALVQCACAVGQGMGPVPFDNEAGRYAADFFREQIGSARTWPRDRKKALHWGRFLGEQIALVVRARNGDAARVGDLERALAAQLKVMGDCPLSP